MLSVLIAGGGTGGHLYPGIAVARELLAREPSARVTFVGTAAGIEVRVIPREGFPLELIRSAGLKGKSLPSLARGLAMLPLGGIDAWRVLARVRPSVVIGVGGYSSGPVVALAAMRRIPTMLLEQNALPGLTNRLLAPLVRAAAVSYDETRQAFGSKAFAAGNPVRPEFFTEPATSPGGGPVRLLVFGGSQGAHAINGAMAAAAPGLAGGRIAITHQTGERDLATVQEAYQRAGVDARVEPFLYAMHREMASSDLVVCRAGATTLAELTAAGRPAILVPLPTAADDHQRRNAEALARRGAADVIDQRALTGERLAEAILALANDEPRRRAMAAAARQMARPDAARVIVNRVLELVR